MAPRRHNISLQRTSARGLAAEAASFGRRIAAVCAIVVATVSFGADRLDLGVRGVKLGTLRPAVVDALGRAIRTEADHDTEMGMGDLLDLTYPGLKVEMCKPEAFPPRRPATEFHVWRIQVTDRKWEVSPGLRVGESQSEVERILGKPESIDRKGATTTLHYSPFSFDAFMWVELKNGVVVEIGMAEDWA